MRLRFYRGADPHRAEPAQQLLLSLTAFAFMLVQISNNAEIVAGWLMGRFPQRVGHLYSPYGLGRIYEFCPYSLDNGKFAVWSSGKEWDADGYRTFLAKVASQPHAPRWALVPDSVADPEGTLREWHQWAPEVARHGWPLAFAVQDGMGKSDVPKDAQVVFVGGSTEWKRKTMHDWCDWFPRVHVGRINTNRWLWECHEAGVESCDGTGWFRGDQLQLLGLVEYLEDSAAGRTNPRGAKLWT